MRIKKDIYWKEIVTVHQTLFRVFILIVALVGALVAKATPVSTSFTFQGVLKDNSGMPVNGPHDIRVTLYTAAVDVPPNNSSLANRDFVCQPVNNGLFSLQIDFGGFNASLFSNCEARWLGFAFRACGTTNAFVVMTNRIELLPTPFAIESLKACSVEPNAVTTVSILDGSVTAPKIAVGQAVKSLNGLHDAVNLIAGANVTLTPSGNDIQISATGTSGTGIWNLNGNKAYYNAGNVGIGTSNPSKRLEAQGPGDVEIGLKSTDLHGLLWTIQSSGGSSVFPNPIQPWEGSFQIIDRSAGLSRLSILSSGRVGIGTIQPLSRFHSVAESGAGNAIQGTCSDAFATAVYGEHTAQGWAVAGRSTGTGIGVYGENTNPNGWAGYFNGKVYTAGTISWASSTLATDQGGAIELGNSINNGNVPHVDFHFGVGADQDFNVRLINDADRQLTLDGNLNVTANASVCTLTIRGGCDLAEPFQMSDSEVCKGSLVIIDEDHEGSLKLAAQEYDTRVAGIISGANGVNPGISLHQEGMIEGGQNVALSGRVYALADASYGAIRPGDLLTSSVTPGHVMKVGDHRRAQGAIVGKAMSGLKEGKGTVLVLVTLQ